MNKINFSEYDWILTLILNFQSIVLKFVHIFYTNAAKNIDNEIECRLVEFYKWFTHAGYSDH